MKRAIRLTLILVLLLSALTGKTLANARDKSPAELWPEVTGLVRAGDLSGARTRLQDLVTAGTAVGVHRFPLYAASAMAMAGEASQKGNRPLADWGIAAARLLDSKLPDVEFATADLARSRSDWPMAITALAAGVRKTYSNYRSQVLALSDLAILVASSVALLSLAFGVLLFYRYARSAVHDFRELLSLRVSVNTSIVLAWAAMFLPIILWLGPGWLVIYWMALLFSYANLPERIVTVLLMILLALIPPMLAVTAYRLSGIDSPIIRAAVASLENSYDPESLRRLKEMHDLIPDNPILPLLMGNMELQQANEGDAAVNFREALQQNGKLAGAHINLGNLYYLENDFQTANIEYERAAQADPTLAIAYYNHSVSSGELYKFDEQGQQLELARQRDPALIERLLATPPQQKVVMYHLSLGQAWSAADAIARGAEARQVYGNHALYDPVGSWKNPVSIGVPVVLLLAVALWLARRRDGVAGACVKCGRTFCHRCKATRENAAYCTQCIHIYLRRGGVPVDTKRQKLAEVEEFQERALRNRKALNTVLPGSGQLFNDATVRGVLALAFFTFFITLAFLTGKLAPVAAPATTMKLALRIIGAVLAACIWLASAIPIYREKAQL